MRTGEGEDADPAFSPALGAGIVAAAGALGWLVTPLVSRPLDCSTAATLVASYRSRFLLRVAIAEAASLVGFVMALVTYEPWPFFVGLAFTLVGFLRAMPTARNLARDQDDLSVAGCAHPLAATLGAPGPAAPAGPIS